MLGVPVEHRRENRDRQRTAEPQLPRQQISAVFRHPDQPEDDACAQKQHGVLGKKTQTSEDTDQDPPVSVLRGGQFSHTPKSEAPEED